MDEKKREVGKSRGGIGQVEKEQSECGVHRRCRTVEEVALGSVKVRDA